MNFDEPLIAYCPGEKRVRPSDWLNRLMGIVAAHWAGRPRPLPCGTCSACPGTTCFVYPQSLQARQPKMVQDLQFCLHILGIPEVTNKCPRHDGSSDLDHQNAA